jgi:uncharacterized protein YdeI (YjbR/CyaY-like superfamily)
MPEQMNENIIYLQTRVEWRVWLEANFATKKEIWLVYPKKASGETRIQYNDAVEEALCFGWIDSTYKTYDENNTIQRFSPRKPKSKYSQANIERLKWLLPMDLIHYSLVDSIQKIITQQFVFPKDIINAIKKDDIAWENYQTFSDSYQRIRIAYIEGARKRPEEFAKRLNNFIEKTHANTLIPGFGGIDKYY